jgi:hypothetical protein
MTTYAHDDLRTILVLHQKWLQGAEDGKRANLRSADLSSADLSSADLRSADLRSANLRSANLSSADLSSADLRSADLRSADLRYARLVEGITFAEYLNDVVPALLTAGGRTLAEVATPETWACHSWENCPMHAAFGVKSLQKVPALHRWQAERFVQLYDAKLIPLPTIPAAA